MISAIAITGITSSIKNSKELGASTILNTSRVETIGEAYKNDSVFKDEPPTLENDYTYTTNQASENVISYFKENESTLFLATVTPDNDCIFVINSTTNKAVWGELSNTPENCSASVIANINDITTNTVSTKNITPTIINAQ